MVGLNPEHINRYPHQFSGGQRQRIGIARALALQPGDHRLRRAGVGARRVGPGAGDEPARATCRDEFGLSYIFIAHDLSVVRHISDRVAVMYLGKIVETGTEDDIYERAAHPYTQALLSAVPVPTRARAAASGSSLVGDVPSPANPPSGCRFRTRCWKAQEICARRSRCCTSDRGSRPPATFRRSQSPAGSTPEPSAVRCCPRDVSAILQRPRRPWPRPR